MIRALHVLPETGWAGTEKQCCYLLEALPLVGVSPELVIFRPGRGHDRFEALDIPITQVGTGRRVSRELATRVSGLRVVIGESTPDLIHSWLFESHLVALLAKGRKGKTPLVLSNRAESVQDGAWPYVVATRLLRRRVGLVLANSRGAETMARGMGFHGDQLVTIPNGYPSRPPTGSLDSDTVLEGIGVRPGEGLVLTIGRPNRNKGYGTLLAAMHIVREQRPKAKLAFAGSTAAELNELGYDVPSWAVPLGWRDDVTDLMEAADCIAHPSDSEGQSNAVQEALLLGRPVVSTDTGGHVETVRAAGGKVVPTRDPREMAAAIGEMLEHPPHLHQVREGTVLTPIEEVARRTADAYQLVLGVMGRA